MPPIVYVGRALVPGTARDLSNSVAPLEDGTPADTLGGFGSGIAWSGVDDRYVAVPDRGPSGGATRFAARGQWMDVRVDARSPSGATANLIATTLFVDERGRSLVGRSDAFDESSPEQGLRFDAEAVRVSRNGTLFVADEYGPWVVEFSRTGVCCDGCRFPSTSACGDSPPRRRNRWPATSSVA